MECRLLALPGELLNTIYDLAFSFPEAAEVDLLQAQSPSKALLMTCHHIYEEARLIQRDAHRAYWSTQTFTLRPDVSTKPKLGVSNLTSGIRKLTLRPDVNVKAKPEVANLMSAIRKLKKDDVRHITTLKVLGAEKGHGCGIWSFHEGLWTDWFHKADSTPVKLAQRLVVPPERASEVVKAGLYLIISATTKWKATAEISRAEKSMKEIKDILQSPGLDREEIVWAVEMALNIGYSGGAL